MIRFCIKQIVFVVLGLLFASMLTIWFWAGVEKAQWPVDFSQMNASSVSFPPPDQTYQRHIQQNLFENAKVITNEDLKYPEDLAVSSNGTIYTAMFDGRVLRISPQGEIETLITVNGSGMQAGIILTQDEANLYFVNENYGLMKLSLATLELTALVSEFEGKPLVTLNSLAVDEHLQVVYLTESSSTVPFKYMGKEFLLRQPSGRVLSYDLRSKETKVIVEGLCFPNGIVTDPAKQSIVVAELNMYRLLRHYVSGPKKGTTEVLLSNLFGYPDNLKWDEEGTLLVAVPAIRQPSIEFLNEWPSLRKMLLYIPDKFLSPQTKVAGGIKVDPESGQILQYLFGDSGVTDFCSTVLEKRGRLYFGSLKNPTIVVLPVGQERIEASNDQL